MNAEKRIQILKILNSNSAYHNIELIYNSDFELLIAVLLSAHSRDAIVNQVTSKLFSVANNPYQMLNLGYKRIQSYIKYVGIYKKKAKNIIQICNILIKKHKENFPNNRKDLENLPGIGRKSANVILNILFSLDTIAVDTHTFRVSNRTEFATGKNVQVTEKMLLKYTPQIFKKKIHFLFHNHGKYVCKSRGLNCSSCCIEKYCEYKFKIFNT